MKNWHPLEEMDLMVMVHLGLLGAMAQTNGGVLKGSLKINLCWSLPDGTFLSTGTSKEPKAIFTSGMVDVTALSKVVCKS